MRGQRSGYSLLEVALAASLMALAIIPAMKFMATSIHAGKELETWNEMNVLAVGILEEQMAVAAIDFTVGSQSGNFASLGLGSLRYSASRSTAALEGGIDDRLMVVQVTVWNDENSNTGLDSGEPSVSYATKVAKMTQYQ